MKNIQIKEIMTPIQEYLTIREDQTLFDVFQLLESHSNITHRDIIVVGAFGDFIGKITMMDIFKALEPNYKKLFKSYDDGVLTKRYVLGALKDYHLWREPIKDICQRGSMLKVSEFMHVPGEYEYVQEEDSIEKALHEYVMGAHQPLIVKKEDDITGILRFEDLYEVIHKHMLACPVPS